MRSSKILTLLLVVTSSSFSQAEEVEPLRHAVYMVEAENTSLSGPAQSSGGAVWIYSGKATWDVIVKEATYRLFVRVRSGHAGDHYSGVKDKTAYRARVGDTPVEFKLVPGTLLYGSDESNWSWIVADVGKLAQGAHSVVFSADWHFAKWDSFVLTTDQGFTPTKAASPFKETERDLSLLSSEQTKWFQGYSLWRGNVEENCPPTVRPEDSESVGSISIIACRNQRAMVAVNVTNWLDQPLLFRVRRNSRIREQDELPALPQEAVSLRYAIPLPAPRQDQLADALPRLGDAGLLNVPANETRQIWVAINCSSLSSDSFLMEIDLQPLTAPGRCVVQTLAIKVAISDIELPMSHPLDIFLCEYDTNIPGMGKDLSGHFVNWYHNCLIPHPATPNPQFGSLTNALNREMQFDGARQTFFEHWHFRTDDSWKKSANRSVWVNGIRKWANYLHKELKLGYDEYTLHIYDEVSGEGIDLFLHARDIIREADPKIRVTMTVTPHISIEEVSKLDPGVDVWCPHMNLYMNRPEVMQFLHKTGKPIVPYYCAENKRFWSAQTYRRWAWKLYEQGASGMFMWTWLAGDAWDGRSWDGGMVFKGNNGVIPSRRWEMMRVGLEDWLLLDMAKKSGHGEKVDQLVKSVLDNPEDGAVTRKARAELVHLLSEN